MNIFIYFILVTLSLVSFGSSAQASNKHDRGEASIFDFRAEKLDKNVVSLSGPWEFHWNKLLDPATARHQKKSIKRITLPHSWKGIPGAGQFGYVTYRTQLLVPETNKVESYSLYLNKVGTSYKIWVNGIQRNGVGTVGTSLEETRPMRKVNVVTFDHKADGKPIEIVIQVANFQHNLGGLKDIIYFGKTNRIVHKSILNIGVDIACCFMLLTVFIYHTFIYYFRKQDRYHKFIAIFSLLLAGYASGSGQNIITIVFPSIPWTFYMKALHLTVTIPVFYYNNLILTMFRGQRKGNIGIFIDISSVVYSFFIIVSPVSVFTKYLFLFHIILLFSLCYWSVVLIKSIIRKKFGAKAILFGLLFYIFSAVVEMLDVNQVLILPSLLPPGLLSMVFSYAAVLAHRYSDSFKIATKTKAQKDVLYKELKDAIDAEKNIIEEKELIEQKLKNSIQRLGKFQKSLSNIDYISGINLIADNLDNILYIKTNGGICDVFGYNGKLEFSVNVSLNKIIQAEALKNNIIQCSKSYAINHVRFSKINKVNRKYEVVLDNGKSIPAGEVYIKRFQSTFTV